MSNTDLTRTTASAPAVVRIAAHGYEVGIDADRGGRIVSATFYGVDVLRRDMTTGASSALEAACFPLVPYSNRIRCGQFTFAGETHQLAPNWDGDAHVIHGEGWLRSWDIVEQDASRALLRLTGGDGWPWLYECLQEIKVGPDGIGLSLALRNTGQTPMPAGLGFHPYFPRSASTRLQFDAKRIWPPLGDTAPTPQVPDSTNSFATLRPVSDCVLDHCFDGWPGTARITQADNGLDLTIKTNGEATHCVVYTPANEPYFCFEPVTHCTGAFEADDICDAGLKILQPGETFNLAVTISVRRL